MKSPINILVISIHISIFLVLGSCGKVVQKATSDSKKVPVFSLSIKVENIELGIEQKNKTATSNTPLLISPKTPSIFSYKYPIFLSLKGYSNNKAHDLAWGKAILKRNNKKEDLKSKPVLPTKNSTLNKVTTTYKGFMYDKKNISVTTAKQSQFDGKFNQSKKEWNFTTNNVKKTYDYYLSVIYTPSANYQMTIIDQAEVSSNKKIMLDTKLINTFKSLVFINAFRTLEFDQSYFNAIDILFDETFFNSLNYIFPKFNKKELAKKNPIFKASDPIIETCITLLELSMIDIKEAIAYINNLDKKFFTDSQKEILLDNIKQFEQTNS
ncbi:hypothetical protein CL657_03330 [bacterium]|nr:hypothetical protein [bacterium]|tara:strand:- start:1901 stop:2875 length:975 start_codon:yes stop_codon:yes gene_type:complete